MLSYLYFLLIIAIIVIIYKYRKKIRLNDVLLASIVVVIGCSLYKGRKVEGLCLNIDASADSQARACENNDSGPSSSCDSPGQCLYQEVDAGLTYAFRHANLGHDAATHPTQADWNTWLSSSAHCAPTDPTDQADISSCGAVSELSDSTACLAVMKADEQTSACSYYASGSTTAATRDQSSSTATCTGTLTRPLPDGTTACSAIPAFVASTAQTDCPTDNGCTFTPSNTNIDDTNSDNTNVDDTNSDNTNGNATAELFKLEYSNDDSGLFTSVYDCVSTTDTDSDKITCPDDKKILNTSGKTDSKIGGTLLSWLFGKPSSTVAKSKCCTSTTSEPTNDDS